MTGELYIDGVDAYTMWGLSFEDSAVSALITPAPSKKAVENESRLQHGKRVIDLHPKYESREVVLPMHITAPSRTAFFTRYNSFCQEVLSKGFFTIQSAYVPNTWFRVKYLSCPQLREFRQQLAVFSLKVEEMNTDDRQETPQSDQTEETEES